MLPPIELAPGSEDNGLAVMLTELVRQNIESKPGKATDIRKLRGSFAIVAEDAGVALTLVFNGRGLTVHDGILGIPDVTIRAPSDSIIALSNLPISGPFGLPYPLRGDKEAALASRAVTDAMNSGALHAYGALLHIPSMLRLTRVMSVNG